MARRIEGAAREALLQRRHALLDLRNEQAAEENELLAEREIDPTDRAAVESESGRIEILSEVERQELGEVQGALGRIDVGSYGLCASCGEQIAARRLEAIPWARLCMACASDAELHPTL